MRRFASNSILAVALVLPAFTSIPAHAQGKRGGVMNRRPPARPQRPDQEAKDLEKISKMTPDQRQKALAHVPPERRQAIEARLKQYNDLSSEEKGRLQNQLNQLHNYTPERQQAIRNAIGGIAKLPPDRQLAVRQEIRQLRAMPEADRQARMNTPEFQQRFKKHEQKMIQELHDVVPQ